MVSIFFVCETQCWNPLAFKVIHTSFLHCIWSSLVIHKWFQTIACLGYVKIGKFFFFASSRNVLDWTFVWVKYEQYPRVCKTFWIHNEELLICNTLFYFLRNLIRIDNSIVLLKWPSMSHENNLGVILLIVHTTKNYKPGGALINHMLSCVVVRRWVGSCYQHWRGSNLDSLPRITRTYQKQVYKDQNRTYHNALQRSASVPST